MKNKKALILLIVAILLIGSVTVYAIDYFASEPKLAYVDYVVPEGASTMTARFYVADDFADLEGVEFSMMSEDGQLIIHINKDTMIYFEDYVPRSDNSIDGYTRMVREVLFDRTTAEVLDGRNLTVTYDITTRSIPPQTTPISIVVLFEEAVTLPATIEMP